MIRSLFKLIFTAQIGFGLMGCSGDVVAQKSDSSQENPKSLTFFTNTIAFENNETCPKKSSEDVVLFTLTDETKFSLPRISLKSVVSSDKKMSLSSSTMSDVTQINFFIPIIGKENTCDSVVPAYIFPTEMKWDSVIGLEGEGYSTFPPSFSPVHSFRNVSKNELSAFFNKPEISTINLDELKIQLFQGLKEMPKGFRSRWTKEQSEFLASVRLKRPFPVIHETGRVCSKLDNNCIFYDIHEQLDLHQNKLWFINLYQSFGDGFTLQVTSPLEKATSFTNLMKIDRNKRKVFQLIKEIRDIHREN